MYAECGYLRVFPQVATLRAQSLSRYLNIPPTLYTPTPAITVYTPPQCVPYSEHHTRLCKHTAFGCIPAYTQATSIYTTLPVCVPLELYPYSHPRTRLLRKSLN